MWCQTAAEFKKYIKFSFLVFLLHLKMSKSIFLLLFSFKLNKAFLRQNAERVKSWIMFPPLEALHKMPEGYLFNKQCVR